MASNTREKAVRAAPDMQGATRSHGGPAHTAPVRLWRHLSGNHLLICGAVAASLVATSASIAQPLAMRGLVDTADSRPTGPLLVLMAVLILGAAGTALQALLLQTAAEGLIRQLRQSLADKLLRLPVVEIDQRRHGDLISRVGSDTTLLRNVVTSGFFDLASAALTLIGATAVMFWLSPTLLAVTAASILVGVGITLRLGRSIRNAGREAQHHLGTMTALVGRSLSALRTVRAAGSTDREAARISQAASDAYSAGVRIARFKAGIQPLVSLSVQTSFITVLVVGGLRVSSGAMTMGDLAAFMFALFLLVSPLSRASVAYTEIQNGLAALERIEEILHLPAEEDGDSACRGGGGTARTATSPAEEVPRPAAIEFREVSFHYPGGRHALDRVSVRIEHGTRTAIVGPSGAGKTTLLALIERFYSPDAGTLLVGGCDVTALDRTYLRSMLGYIEQSAPVLAGSLADNLRLGVPDATPAQMRRALEEVGLHDVLQGSTEGLNTQLGEGGVLLSGGQRQRLAWARVLLDPPAILLLDEPTASVDSRSEGLLTAELDRVSADRTLVVVAHRLSTVLASDHIIVLDQGAVADFGTHDELLHRSPLYRELAAQQFISAPPGVGCDRPVPDSGARP